MSHIARRPDKLEGNKMQISHEHLRTAGIQHMLVQIVRMRLVSWHAASSVCTALNFAAVLPAGMQPVCS